MLIKSTKFVFAAGLLLCLTSGNSALGQHPMEALLRGEVENDLQLFAPVDPMPLDGTYPKSTGMFASYDRLYWTTTKPSIAPIGSQNPSPVFTALLGTFDQNSLSTGLLNASFGWGNRFEFGYMGQEGQGFVVGILRNMLTQQVFQIEDPLVLFSDPFMTVSPTFQDANGDGFDDDLNGNNIYGRDGEDTGTFVILQETTTVVNQGTVTTTTTDVPTIVPPLDGIPDIATPTDFGDAIFFPRYNMLVVSSNTKLNGFEVMGLIRAPRLVAGGNFEFLYGVRYFILRDQFTISAIGGPLDESRWDTVVKNNVVGPQIGMRWSRQMGKWFFVSEGRFTAGANFQDAQQTANIATESDEPAVGAAGQTGVVGLGSESSSSAEEFTPLGEVRVELGYKFGMGLQVRGGYTGHYMGAIARASNRIDYTLPTLGLVEKPGEATFVNGVNVALEYNR